MLKKKFFVLVFFAVLLTTGAAFADGMAPDGNMEEMRNMVPYHVTEILVALAVIPMVWSVINATGQKNVFIYLPIAMVFFAAGSVVGYSPHQGWMHDHNAETGEVVLNTIGLALIGISFYKWKKMLG